VERHDATPANRLIDIRGFGRWLVFLQQERAVRVHDFPQVRAPTVLQVRVEDSEGSPRSEHCCVSDAHGGSFRNAYRRPHISIQWTAKMAGIGFSSAVSESPSGLEVNERTRAAMLGFLPDSYRAVILRHEAYSLTAAEIDWEVNSAHINTMTAFFVSLLLRR
jgi:hypothetical protein